MTKKKSTSSLVLAVAACCVFLLNASPGGADSVDVADADRFHALEGGAGHH